MTLLERVAILNLVKMYGVPVLAPQAPVWTTANVSARVQLTAGIGLPFTGAIRLS